ncbi:uncharacterized protein LOC133305232 [Gastrolobium bilobum]|uniref:uncharacterized protein LOC133305232 n=1 Tax=Gastrolobium bilobum TaxID=150636 RepID=UPI002AB1AF61|nr:uncharacterized protein LOC133305232 [Gastrolobium bilobum]
MQEKLDNLCELVNNTEEQSLTYANDGELVLNETLGFDKIKVVDCGCWRCDKHDGLSNELVGSSVILATGSNGNEVIQYKSEEPEERRMSDLSDWASSSVTSAADIQLNTLAVEQDIYNLKRDSEEKDTTIKELTTLLNSSEVANSKRVAELEDILRRKNTTITKLKKDLVFLEQKVVQLSRLNRPSFSASDKNGGHLPKMRDNLLYDMESTTSPSSSDSDSAPVINAKDLAATVDLIGLNQSSALAIGKKSAPVKPFSSSEKSRSVAPFKEISTYRKPNAASSSSQYQLSARGDLKKSKRRSLSGAKGGTAHKE